MTLWLPWLDTGKSYRHMVNDLKSNLPQKYNCIAGVRIGDSQRAMLQYFGDLNPKRNATRVCDLLLVQGSLFLDLEVTIRNETHPLAPFNGDYFRLKDANGYEYSAIVLPVEEIIRADLPAGSLSGQGSAYILSHEPNNSLVAVNRLLKGGYEVSWLSAAATIGITPGGNEATPLGPEARRRSDRRAVARRSRPLLQIRQRDRHVEFLRQLLKVPHPRRVTIDRLSGPALARASLVGIEESVPDVPHLREQS